MKKSVYIGETNICGQCFLWCVVCVFSAKMESVQPPHLTNYVISYFVNVPEVPISSMFTSPGIEEKVTSYLKGEMRKKGIYKTYISMPEKKGDFLNTWREHNVH